MRRAAPCSTSCCPPLREPSPCSSTHPCTPARTLCVIWGILTPQEGSRGSCVTTLISVTLGRFIAWPIGPSLGAIRQPKKTGGHHVKYICNVIYSRVSHWPQTTPHADASDPRFVRPPRGSPRPEAGLVYTGASTRMVPAIGLRCHRPLRNCNGIPVRLSACLHGGSRGPGGDAARRSVERPPALARCKLAHVAAR